MIGKTRIGRHSCAVWSITVVAMLAALASLPALAQGPTVSSFAINSGAAAANGIAVTLNNTATNSPSDYMASESASFSGATWLPYATAPSFSLSIGVGPRTVYFKVKNIAGESSVVSDTIFLAPEMLPVAAGTFTMGNSGVGDDATYGMTYESPPHAVTLSAYDVAKYITTNKQYCDLLNWALAQGGHLKTSTGAPWAGTGDVYGGSPLQLLIEITEATRPECNIKYVAGTFSCKTRTGVPSPTEYPMDTHPVESLSWYGAVAFCNWLSEWQGLTPCYNMTATYWPLTTPPPMAGGYRLPTEAEWERAAAWDGSKHWIYGFTSDTLTGNDRVNFCPYYPAEPYVNPLGIIYLYTRTSPVGWFDGMNISPNGNVQTVNSVSPVGAYDMSGNLWEWCTDWYLSTYYNGGPMTNPTGPATGANKVMRGGAFRDVAQNCRTATRDNRAPTVTPYWRSFRIARTPLVITEQPEGANLYVGENHTFTVAANIGNGTPVYQWKFDNRSTVQNVGTNASTYAITGAALNQAGTYWCEITYDGSVYPSDRATLGVINHLSITTQPVGGSAHVGSDYTFSIGVTGGLGPITYQWRKDGEVVDDGTNSSYTISPVVLADEADYECTVTDENNNETVVSNTVHLIVLPEALPVAGPAILALLAVSFVLAGRRSLRQRK